MPKNKGNILIIDDNEEVLTALKMYLSKHFDVIMTEKSPNLIPHKIEREEIDVIILDMNFSAGVNTGNEGIFWLREIIKRDPSIIVIMITAYGDVDLAVKAVKEGATDFITKPWDNKRILTTIRNAMKIRHSGQEITKLKEQKKHFTEKIDKSYPLLHGESAVMRELIITVGKVAKTDANVLILGENGTGKELIA
ncbi:sigma-54-dependent transcriptional regulator, partial [Bacteroidota bacterium]